MATVYWPPRGPKQLKRLLAIARTHPDTASSPLDRAWWWLERHTPALLSALIVLFAGAYTAINIWRIGVLRQGFDVLFYEQPIWNTVHGRPFAQSAVAIAPTDLGLDLMWFELWVAPVYALWQSPVTLFTLVSVGAALGALPVFLLARERFGSRVVGLVWSLLYLAFMPVGSIAVWEFQPRLFSATALLFAVWWYRRGRLTLFWIAVALALSVRSDVGLAVGALGALILLERRAWRLGLATLIVGFGYWVLAVYVIVPALSGGGRFHWQVNYAWLGATSGEMLRTMLRRPLYVLNNTFTLDKMRYLAQLVFPLGCLPLLKPRWLVPALPILALNLLSDRAVQFDIFHQYQALIVPFLFLASIHALADLLEASGRRAVALRTLLAVSVLAVAVVLLPVWPGNATSRNALNHTFAPLIWVTLATIVAVPVIGGLLRQRAPAPRAAVGVGGVLLFLMALQHVLMGSEAVRLLKQPRPSPRLPAARAVVAAVPADAPLAVTSQLGIHVPLRRELYAFPGNDLYDPALVQRARYVLGDRQRSPEESAAIDQLLTSGSWRLLREEGGFVLLERR